jgi:hypothetical protein
MGVKRSAARCTARKDVLGTAAINGGVVVKTIYVLGTATIDDRVVGCTQDEECIATCHHLVGYSLPRIRVLARTRPQRDVLEGAANGVLALLGKHKSF